MARRTGSVGAVRYPQRTGTQPQSQRASPAASSHRSRGRTWGLASAVRRQPVAAAPHAVRRPSCKVAAAQAAPFASTVRMTPSPSLKGMRLAASARVPALTSDLRPARRRGHCGGPPPLRIQVTSVSPPGTPPSHFSAVDIPDLQLKGLKGVPQFKVGFVERKGAAGCDVLLRVSGVAPDQLRPAVGQFTPPALRATQKSPGSDGFPSPASALSYTLSGAHRVSPRTRRLLTTGVAGQDSTPDISLTKLFKLIDRDGDGSLDVAEIVTFMDSHPQWQEFAGLTKGYTEFLEIMDADKSGRVDKKEFCEGLWELRRRALQQMGEREYTESLKMETQILRNQLNEMFSKRKAAAHSSDSDSDSDPKAVTTRAAGSTPVFTDRRGKRWRRSNQMLGKGAFGEVWLAMSEDGTLVAMKTLQIPTNFSGADRDGPQRTQTRRMTRARARSPSVDDALSDMLQEVQLLCDIRHRNIVSYLSSYVDLRDATVSILMEYLSGGSLQQCLKQFNTLPDPAVRKYLRDAITGLAFLHSKGVVHRDVKPGNILLDKGGACKLSDFGTCAQMCHMLTKSSAPIGTPLYMAPEAAKGEVKDVSDVWAIGISALQLVTGELPWDCENPTDPKKVSPPGPGFVVHAFLFQLARRETMLPIIPDGIHPQLDDFARVCLKRDAGERPAADALLGHPYLQESAL